MTATDRQVPTTTITQVYRKLPAQDVERARTFYAEKLGLAPFWERAQHLHYQVGGAHFIIYPSRGTASATHDQLGLVVEDVEAEVARLKALGVSFESYPPPPGVTMTNDIMNYGHIKAAWFKDSEANLISIAEFPFGSPFAQ